MELERQVVTIIYLTPPPNKTPTPPQPTLPHLTQPHLTPPHRTHLTTPLRAPCASPGQHKSSLRQIFYYAMRSWVPTGCHLSQSLVLPVGVITLAARTPYVMGGDRQVAWVGVCRSNKSNLGLLCAEVTSASSVPLSLDGSGCQPLQSDDTPRICPRLLWHTDSLLNYYVSISIRKLSKL